MADEKPTPPPAAGAAKPAAKSAAAGATKPGINEVDDLEVVPLKSKGLSSTTKIIIASIVGAVIFMGGTIAVVIAVFKPKPAPVAPVDETAGKAADSSKKSTENMPAATDETTAAEDDSVEEEAPVDAKPAVKEEKEEVSKKVVEKEATDESAVSSGGGGATTLYYTIKPAFVVNFQYKGRMRFLQVSVDVMAHDEKVINAIDKHSPRIKNDLVALFSSQDFEALQTQETRQAMRAKALKVVQRILEEEIGDPGADQVLFTSFVMQ